MKKLAALALFISLLIAPTGCSLIPQSGDADDYVTTTYKALKSAAIIYDEGMSAMADAHALGLIDDEARDKTIAIGEDFSVAWQAAVDALYLYAVAVDGGQSPEPNTVEEKLALFQDVYNAFTSAVRPYIVRSLTNREVTQ